MSTWGRRFCRAFSIKLAIFQRNRRIPRTDLRFLPASSSNHNYKDGNENTEISLRSRRLEVVGTRKNGRAKRRHARGEGSLTPHVSPSRAPVLSFAHYFQAPATQATLRSMSTTNTLNLNNTFQAVHLFSVSLPSYRTTKGWQIWLEWEWVNRFPISNTVFSSERPRGVL